MVEEGSYSSQHRRTRMGNSTDDPFYISCSISSTCFKPCALTALKRAFLPERPGATSIRDCNCEGGHSTRVTARRFKVYRRSLSSLSDWSSVCVYGVFPCSPRLRGKETIDAGFFRRLWRQRCSTAAFALMHDNLKLGAVLVPASGALGFGRV